MTHGVLRTSAVALGAAAFAILSPLTAADAAVHHPAHGVHRQVAHVHGRVYAHHNVRHYARGYAYGGYNPGAAAAAKARASASQPGSTSAGTAPSP